MKRSFFITSVFLFCLAWNCLFILQCSELAAQPPLAKVQKIIDGDTIQVRYKTKSIRVRLWGIDTPEYHQAFSKVAKRFTAGLVRNTSVHLDLKDWDKYGRMVAIVTMTDGRSLNEELLKNGLAWVHVYYCKEAICNKWYGYEKRAREKRIGLWRDLSPVPPWVWKHKKKK
jgi:endonuclease YncB( thermonuclease family)